MYYKGKVMKGDAGVAETFAHQNGDVNRCKAMGDFNSFQNLSCFFFYAEISGAGPLTQVVKATICRQPEGKHVHLHGGRWFQQVGLPWGFGLADEMMGSTGVDIFCGTVWHMLLKVSNCPMP